MRAALPLLTGGVACAAAAVLLPASALGASSRVALGSAAVIYDTQDWKAAVSGPDAVTFTCVAADCVNQPHVFATVEAPRDLAAEIAAARRNSRTLPDDGVPPLPFPATAYPSSCRGQDTPIFFAGGQVDDQGYRFTTAITVGCTASAVLPVGRFLELVRGFEAN